MKINKIYLFFVIASFMFAYLAGQNLSYAAFYCLLIGFISSVFDVSIHYKSVDADLNFEKKHFETGDSVQYHVIVSNSSIFPVSSAIIKSNAYSEFEKNYKGHAVNLNFNDNRWIKYTLNFKLRGTYDFGKVTLSIKDFLNIFEVTKNIDKNKVINVYTKIYEIPSIYMTGEEDFEAPLNIKGSIEDLSTVDDIRKYRLGDSLKRIHWKLSAKHGELFTKSFDTLTGRECNLVLDMNRISYFMEDGDIVEEQLVEYFGSVINYMLNNGIGCKVLINNKEDVRFDVSDIEDFKAIKEYFIITKSEGESIFANFLESSSSEIEKSEWIGVFIPKVTNRIKSSILNLKYLGYEISVFYILSDGVSKGNIIDLKYNKVRCISFTQMIREAQ